MRPGKGRRLPQPARGRRQLTTKVQTVRPDPEKWQRALNKAGGDATRLKVGPKGGVTVLPAAKSRRKRSALSGKIATPWIDGHNLVA